MASDTTRSITLPATMASFEALMAFVRQAATEAGYDGSLVGKIALAFEEAVVNVINYAYAEGEGPVEVQVSRTADRGMVIELIDQGAPFNPLEAQEPDISAPAHERPIGGLGIFMVRQIMDSVSYSRSGGSNVLRMQKRPPGGGA
jgi:serine/threonine-protein kinase RsbW